MINAHGAGMTYRAQSDTTGAWHVIDSRLAGYNVIVASVPRLVAVSIAHRLNMGLQSQRRIVTGQKGVTA